MGDCSLVVVAFVNKDSRSGLPSLALRPRFDFVHDDEVFSSQILSSVLLSYFCMKVGLSLYEIVSVAYGREILDVLFNLRFSVLTKLLMAFGDLAADPSGREVVFNALVSFVDLFPHFLFTFSVPLGFSEGVKVFGGFLVLEDGRSLLDKFVSPGLKLETTEFYRGCSCQSLTMVLYVLEGQVPSVNVEELELE